MPLSSDSRRVLDLLAALNPVPLQNTTPTEARASRARNSEALFALAGPPVELARVEDRSLPARDWDIPVRVYRPSVDPRLPVLIYLHGGGWVLGTLDTMDRPCRALAGAADCVVVSVDYRLAPEHRFPAAVEDAYAAAAYVAGHADELGIDPDRIAVGGDSAGANLAAVCALIARERGTPSLRFQLLVYPATDYASDTPSAREYADGYHLTRAGMNWFWSHYLANEEDGRNPYVSPLRAPDLSRLPPAFVLTAECDPIRDEGEMYAARLAEAGVPVRLKRYDGAIHGMFQMAGAIAAGAEALSDAAAALRDAFRAAAPASPTVQQSSV